MKLAVQQHICDLMPYQPGLPIELVARKYGLDPAKIIKLASNENPLGMSPKAKAAVQKVVAEAHRYPDQHALTHKLADKLGAEPGNIVLGNGSNDVLDLVARTFLSHGDEAVSSQYAFAVYQIATQSAGAQNVVVSANNYAHDLDAMLAAVTPNTKIIWIANPNNPTGTFIPYAELQVFLSKVPAHIAVVLDEAYYEYLEPANRVNTVKWLSKHPNLIIVRTFSKIYGLAGLRIGYAIAAPEVAELLNRVRQPFNANALALAAATAALDDDDFVARSVALNTAGAEQLKRGFAGLGIKYLPIYGNFVTFKAGDKAQQIQEEILKRGVILRGLAPYAMLDYLRVSIGTTEDNQRFLGALKEAIAAVA